MQSVLIDQSARAEIEKESCRSQRILIIEELELVQLGLKSALLAEPWVASCLSAGSFIEAQVIIRNQKPQMLLVNTLVNGDSGLKFSRMMAEHNPLAKIVLMSSHGKISMSMATAHGAWAFMPQQLPTAAVLQLLRRVAEGSKVFLREAVPEQEASLSPREIDVLRHLVQGLSNEEVAAELNLSRHTVKQHTSVVYKKLGVRNRVQAASRAQELGLVA